MQPCLREASNSMSGDTLRSNMNKIPQGYLMCTLLLLYLWVKFIFYQWLFVTILIRSPLNAPIVNTCRLLMRKPNQLVTPLA